MFRRPRPLPYGRGSVLACSRFSHRIHVAAYLVTERSSMRVHGTIEMTRKRHAMLTRRSAVLSSILAMTAVATLLASDAAPTMHPRVKLITNRGDIVLELDAEKAPGSVLNFVKYVEDKFYDGTIFHRVVKDYMVQGGGYLPTMEEKSAGLREPILLESHNGLPNVRGSVAMARKPEPHSARAQFYINVGDNRDKLDYNASKGLLGYAVFGKVVEGMEVVDRIQSSELAMHPQFRTKEGPVTPTETVVIEGAQLLTRLDVKKASELAEVVAVAAAKASEAEKLSTMRMLPQRLRRIELEAKATLTSTDSGLMYVDLREGHGAMPALTDRVDVHYKGTLVDGSVFDSSTMDPTVTGPSTLDMRKAIKGWQEGLSTMKEGGKRVLVIPPELGWGAEGIPGRVPPNATLFFEIELLAIRPPEP